jgi:AGCS family alanine or glycine:cation symporter
VKILKLTTFLNMISKHITAMLLLFSAVVYSQELTVSERITNPSDIINDGVIEVKVDGGVEPYTYKWSNQDTPLTSNKAVGLTEGIPYTVTITDAAGNSVTKEYTVPAEAVAEKFNGTFTPIVGSIGSVLFWDPFSAIGIYDPVIYADLVQVPAPGWEPGVEGVFVLKEWLKPNNSNVKEGEAIAIIEKDGQEIIALAPAGGKLEHLTTQSSIIYDSESSLDVIQTGAHKFATIVYDEKVPLLHPNGDKQQKGVPFIVIWLVIGAIFFTIRMGFINFRGFRHAIDLARGKYDDPNAPGQVTHFQALTTAVSGTVGLGNIAGVAVAISVGGAGATFWMILAGLLGMSSKFVECTLGVKYREIAPDGRVFGGPMSYLRKGLERQNKKKLGKVLAAVFAVLCVGASFGGGNMFQANQSFEAVKGQIPAVAEYGTAFGLIIMVLVGAVIIGGIRSIAKVTSRVVPFMASIYIIACIIVISVNIENIIPAFTAIIDGAFSPSALKGGVIGVLILGFQRAVFSNEAGIGSAAIAHSAAKTNNPPSEGFVSLLEPFIDTVVVCTLTALVLIFTGKHEVVGMAGAQLTSDAFGSVISWFPYILTGAIFLFAFSTMISWSYYGMRAWTYLFGKSRKTEMVYKVIFLFFVVVGSSISLGAVLDFSDMMILAMAFPNIIGLYLMSGEVRQDLRDYMRRLKAGELYKTPEEE